MKILAIDTSCDETSVAIINDSNIIASCVYSQILIHTNWGGVVPNLARKAHEEHIDLVIEKTLKKARLALSDIDAFAVTHGPGLAIALEVGIKKAKELSKKFRKPFIPVNHMEGHMMSVYVKNSKGNPKRDIKYPFLSLLVSGAHTELVLAQSFHKYKILGETQDDAAGEALDKAAKMLGFGYPGGPILERLSEEIHNIDKYQFPRGMWHSGDMNFSFSGIKTHFNMFLKDLSDEVKLRNIRYLASSFQESVFASILQKLKKALIEYPDITTVTVGGGVSVNKRLRKLIRSLKYDNKIKKFSKLSMIYFPPYKYLNFDNAAMIATVAFFMLKENINLPHIDTVERIPKLRL